MARRGLAAVLAAFYALQVSWVLYAGVDALAPHRAVADAPPSTGQDSCCAAACGCPADVRARKACCCDPKTASEAPVRSAPGKTSAFEAARCAGVEAAMAQAGTQPVLPRHFALTLIPAIEAAPEVPGALPIPGPLAGPLDKVPIL